MVNEKRNLKTIYRGKKGQVTIFIIIGVLIVVGGVLVYMFTQDIDTQTKEDDLENPESYVQRCVEDDLRGVVERVSMQGGSLNPENTYRYKGEEIEYLCYSGDYFYLCSIQRPFLKEHIENEVEKGIEEQVDSCFSSLEETYKKEEYEVDLNRKDLEVRILPERLEVQTNTTLNLKKEGSSKEHSNFDISLKNDLYEIITVAKSILEWESAYGTSEPSFYMNMYHDLLINKKPQSDDTTIYTIENMDSGNKFQFASRSLAYPPGYGSPSDNIMEQ